MASGFHRNKNVKLQKGKLLIVNPEKNTGNSRYIEEDLHKTYKNGWNSEIFQRIKKYICTYKSVRRTPKS